LESLVNAEQILAQHAMVGAELYVIAAVLLIEFTTPVIRGNWASKAKSAFDRIARRQTMSVTLVFLLTLALRVAIWPAQKLPPPGIHDEFSYLLLGDTFASGRLTNPPHPLGAHFESMHIIQQPSYASVYPVAQGVVLAFGEVLAGAPWLGVWLSVALMCAAICWMLQAWLPPRWALLGGVLAAVRLGTFSYWMNSYWGGAPAALGGALVLGALPRVMHQQRTTDAVILGLGIAILANSRPYEGLLLCVPVALALAAWAWLPKLVRAHFGLCARGPVSAGTMWRITAAVALVLIATGTCMGYYFWRVTGSPWKMPQVLEREQYGIAPFFVWQASLPQHAYHHDAMQRFYTSLEVVPRQAISGYWLFFLGPLLSLPLLAAPWFVCDRRIRFLLITCGVLAVGLGVETWFLPHYAAPMTAALYAILLQGVRHFATDKRGGVVARAIPLALAMGLLVRIGAPHFHIPLTPEWPQSWCTIGRRNYDRANLIQYLVSLGGRHVVIVRYDKSHNPHREWVYNDADIDRSPIVWARDTGPAGNRELLDYFRGREAWLLAADEKPPKLTPIQSAPISAVSRR
jgi:hypothetical protein